MRSHLHNLQMLNFRLFSAIFLLVLSLRVFFSFCRSSGTCSGLSCHTIIFNFSFQRCNILTVYHVIKSSSFQIPKKQHLHLPWPSSLPLPPFCQRVRPGENLSILGWVIFEIFIQTRIQENLDCHWYYHCSHHHLDIFVIASCLLDSLISQRARLIKGEVNYVNLKKKMCIGVASVFVN